MKKFQFLLLDAGPIIKLFELGIWDTFIKKCDITISKIVADEAKWASQEFQDISIDLEHYKEQIKIIDVEFSVVKTFYDKFKLLYQADIHDGEKETLAFLCDSSEKWLVCSADRVVFKVLGLLGKANQGISLEEILQKVGLSRQNLERKYTKKFREKHTRLGQVDSIQDKGLL
jgi:hypothetical protein